MSSEVIAAAAELRAAVRDLAARTTGTELEAAALRDAADRVRDLTDGLTGPPLPRWWEGPADSSRNGLRSYRRRSLFQGELHPFSNRLEWVDAAGPEGEPGYGFRVIVPQLFEGAPGAVHGGYVSGLFDELLGAVQGLADGPSGYTARLTVRYRSFTPIERELRFSGWVAKQVGRRTETKATCHDGNTLCAEADGLFVRPAGAPS